MLSAEPVIIGGCFADQEGLPCLLIPARRICEWPYKHWQELVASECVQKDKHSYFGYLLMKIIFRHHT